ncbi:MAG TPA: hypothetical protein VF399_02255 [bacterium]
MAVLLFVFCVDPAFVITMPAEYGVLEVHDSLVYVAPFFGAGIYRFQPVRGQSRADNMEPLNFTRQENYRILQFEVTPFFIFINNGKTIEKYFFSAGTTETVCQGEQISSFTLTGFWDICYADYGQEELVFLNTNARVMNRLSDVAVIDVKSGEKMVYALTRKKIIRCDEYGNSTGEISLPESLERLYAAGHKLYLFSQARDYFYTYDDRASDHDTTDGSWRKIELGRSIRDLAVLDSTMVMLDNAGTHLLFYNWSEF